MTTCRIDMPASARAVIAGIIIGTLLGAITALMIPVAIRHVMATPEPVPASALSQCEGRLERYAEIRGLADAYDVRYADEAAR